MDAPSIGRVSVLGRARYVGAVVAPRSAGFLFLAGLGMWGALDAQKPFKEYPGREYENFPLPPDWDEKTEWTRARLRYNAVNVHGYRDTEWRSWTIDYPRSDRQ